jgi:raffinose/stachyose/melibiose transport system permease protein
MRKPAWTWFASAVMLLYCSVTVVLVYGVIVNSFKPISELLSGNIWNFPRQFSIAAYKTVLFEKNFVRYIGNSIFIMVLSTLIVVYISALASFGLTKFRFRGRQWLRAYFLLGLSFPINMAVIQLYVLMRQIGIMNTLFSVIMIRAALVSFPILIFSGFIGTLPDSLVEAAYIEGAGNIMIFHRIILPLIKPAIGSVVPLLALGAWNDYLLPLIFLTRRALYTITVGFSTFSREGKPDYAMFDQFFAASAITIIPILLVYLIFSKRIISGIMAGAIKE